MRIRSLRGAILGLLLTTCSMACGSRQQAPSIDEPLLDPRFAPDILVEQRDLTLPPATDGNRFVAGWWPWRVDGHPVLTPLPAGGRLELVHLGQRPRTLVLDLYDEDPPTVGSVRIRLDGRDLGSQPVSDPLQIALPADLTPGRVLVEVLPEDEVVVKVVSAGLRNILPAGDVRIEGEVVTQSGNSAVDFARRVSAGTHLTVTFEPPSSPSAGQEFLLQIERDGQWQTLFQWRGSLTDRMRGRRRLNLPLDDEAGVVRIRCTARGQGPAASWHGLSISSNEPQTAGGEVVGARAEPPRLVLVYVMDALRADHLGGARGATPSLDRLASEGLVFANHRSVAPNTLPSTKALFIGEAFLQGGGEKLPADGRMTLAEAFRQAGYATAMFSNNPYVSATFGVERGFDHVAAPEGNGSAGFYDDAARIHRAALDWLGSVPGDRPVMLYLHALHPHNPYQPPPDLAASFTAGIDSAIDGSTETLIDVQRFRRKTEAADQRRLAALYAAALAYNDRELGKFLGALGERFEPRDSWLAMTADHGEELFDHGGVLHGWTLYEEMIRIPLLLWAPQRIATGRRQDATSTLDLHATLLSLTGQSGAPSEGRTLLGEPAIPANSGERIHLASAASVGGGIFSAQSRRFKLILAPRTERRWGMGEALGRTRDAEYLFDLEADPEELHNLAGSDHPEVTWLRSRLLAWIDAKRTAVPGAAVAIDEETRKRLEALGYLD